MKILFSRSSNDEVESLFKRYFSEKKNLFEQDYLVIYRYGVLQKSSGNKILAQKMQKYVFDNAEDEILKMLANIEISILKSVRGDIAQNIKNTTESLNNKNIRSDDLASILINLSWLINGVEYDAFYNKNIGLYRNIKNDELRARFIATLLYRLGRTKRKMYNLGMSALLKNEHESLDSYLMYLQERAKIANLITKGDYLGSYQRSKSLLESKYGVSETEDLIQLAKDSASDEHLLNEITGFAHVNLFRTRLGHGLTPVRESAEIFNSIYKYNVEEFLKNSSDLTSDYYFRFSYSFLNQLIIGSYLYNQTAEPADLFEPLVNLDAVLGGALYTRIVTNDLATPELRSVLEAYRRNVQAFSDEEDMSLTEIIRGSEALAAEKAAVERDHPEYQALISDNWRTDFTQLQTQLTEDSASLFYFVSSLDSAMYRVEIGDTITSKTLTFNYHDIVSRAERLRGLCHASADRDSLARMAEELYDYLFADVKGGLSPNLHVIANGALEDLPFDLLRGVGADGERYYLGLRHAMSRQFSARTFELFNARRPRPERNAILGMAPTFSGQVLRIDTAERYLSPLAHAPEELDMLRDFGGYQLHYGTAATQERYLRQSPLYSVVHLATHAFSNSADGLESSVYLLDDEGEPARLVASAIAEQHLQARLVTLSACQTGLGGQSILEGNVGLTKAYLAAGVRTVVASLYDVDDFATRFMMRRFYEQSAAGVAPHHAMFNARLKLLERRPDAHPSLWGGFAVYGGLVAPAWEADGPPWLTWAACALAMVGLAVVVYAWWAKTRVR